MRLTHLGIVYDNVLSCVIDENAVVTKIKLIAADDDAAEAETSGNITAHVDMPAEQEEEVTPANTAEVVQLHGGSQPNT